MLAAAAAVLAGVVPAGACPGVLVVHDDGSPAACSEELDGRCCAGPAHQHLGSLSCRELLGMGGCEACAMEAEAGWDDPAWRHAVHRGVLVARRARRCRHRSSSRTW